MDPRPGVTPGPPPPPEYELEWLRGGEEPPGARPKRNGVDITDRPELWTPWERRQREAFLARVEGYKAAGLLDDPLDPAKVAALIADRRRASGLDS